MTCPDTIILSEYNVDAMLHVVRHFDTSRPDGESYEITFLTRAYAALAQYGETGEMYGIRTDAYSNARMEVSA